MKTIKASVIVLAGLAMTPAAHATYWYKPGKPVVKPVPSKPVFDLGTLIDALKKAAETPKTSPVKDTVAEIIDLVTDQKNGKTVIDIDHGDVKAVKDLVAELVGKLIPKVPVPDPCGPTVPGQPEEPSTPTEPTPPLTPIDPGTLPPPSSGGPVAGAVPEPATWGTMVLGFLLLGAAVRARRPQPRRV